MAVLGTELEVNLCPLGKQEASQLSSPCWVGCFETESDFIFWNYSYVLPRQDLFFFSPFFFLLKQAVIS